MNKNNFSFRFNCFKLCYDSIKLKLMIFDEILRKKEVSKDGSHGLQMTINVKLNQYFVLNVHNVDKF